MAFATARSLALKGADGHVIDVQVDVSPGLVGTTIIGRVDKSLSEARDRVRMAINNDCGRWPATKRVTILLAPADLPKSGTHYDLAIAVAVMAADKQHEELLPEHLAGWAFIGELSVSGGLRPVPGVLPMVIAAAARGIGRVFVPEPQAAEAALVPGMTVFGVRSLAQVSAVLRGVEVPEAEPVVAPSASPLATWRGEDRLADLDLRDLDGLEDVRYAVEVAAAGGHPPMLVGPRGTGKTSIAERIPSLLPDLTTEQALEVTALHSVAGTLARGQRPAAPPAVVRPAPLGHRGQRAGRRHRARAPRPGQPGPPRRALPRRVPPLPQRRHRGDAPAPGVRGGHHRPGRGVGDLPRPVVGRARRQPVPVRQLPRPVGRRCECTEVQRVHYRRKLTGPILDRVDIWMEVRPQGPRPAVSFAPDPESSDVVRARVTGPVSASPTLPPRHLAAQRLLPGSGPAEHWPLEPEAQRLVDAALSAGELTRRGLTRVQRLAWTVADCAGVVRPGAREAAIALALRSHDAGRSLPADVVRAAS